MPGYPYVERYGEHNATGVPNGYPNRYWGSPSVKGLHSLGGVPFGGYPRNGSTVVAVPRIVVTGFGTLLFSV